MSTFSQTKPAKQGLLFHFKEKVLRCFGFTTAHGYGRVADSKSRPQTWFWCLVCAAAFGIFLQQLYVITQQYISKPLKTRTSIGHNEKIAFPQITLCNLNIIRRSKIPNSILTQFPGILGGPIIGSNRTASSKPRKTQTGNQAVPNFEDLPEKEKLIQNVLEKLAEIPIENLESYGHQLEDMILSCHYNSMECLEDDMRKYWTRFWHRRYGNCYTFNKGMDATGTRVNVMNTSQPGVGLTLEINIEQHEYVSHLSQEAGIRIYVGVQTEMPFPYEQGISVSPGFSTAMQLRKLVIGRLDPFENNSCKARTDFFHESMFGRYNVTYTSMACKMSCLASMMNSSCGCVIQSLRYDNKPLCRTTVNSSLVKCVNAVFVEFDNGSCNKDCKETCREEVFKAATSLAKWPSSQYKSTLNAEIEAEVRGNHSKEISDHFLKLKIYYGELNFEVIEEEEAYTMPRFLSDIGGLMGMWIGISVLTVVELLELIATLLITMFKPFTKKEERVTDEKPSENCAPRL